jgi:hypothetical protein
VPTFPQIHSFCAWGSRLLIMRRPSIQFLNNGRCSIHPHVPSVGYILSSPWYIVLSHNESSFASRSVEIAIPFALTFVLCKLRGDKTIKKWSRTYRKPGLSFFQILEESQELPQTCFSRQRHLHEFCTQCCGSHPRYAPPHPQGSPARGPQPVIQQITIDW